MEVARWIAGGALLAFGLYVVACSYVRLTVNLSRRRDPDSGWSSPVPFVGPALVIAGWAMLPAPFSPWIALAFLLDPDTVITVLPLLSPLRPDR